MYVTAKLKILSFERSGPTTDDYVFFLKSLTLSAKRMANVAWAAKKKKKKIYRNGLRYNDIDDNTGNDTIHRYISAVIEISRYGVTIHIDRPGLDDTIWR